MAELGTYLADVLLKCKVIGLATPDGEPPLMQAQLAIVGDDASLAIPALKGDKGDDGTAATPFKWQWPSLDSTGELPTLTNTPGDIGKSYVVNDGAGTADIAYWTGTAWQYFPDAFGPGLPGPAPDITATGELVDEDDDFEVEVSGSAENPLLHFKIPATPGPAGPSGGWNLYDATASRDEGMIPVWDEASSRFVPRTWGELPAFPRVLRYTQPEGNFIAYSGTASSQLISTMALPALDYPYHVDVSGHVRVGQNAFSSAQVGVVGRLGDATTGQLVAKGLSVTSGPCIIGPHYSSQASGETGYSSTPDGARGRVPAGTPSTLYLTALRESGSGSWYANAIDAQLAVELIPADG